MLLGSACQLQVSELLSNKNSLADSERDAALVVETKQMAGWSPNNQDYGAALG